MNFGAARRADWPLDPDVTYLNHGTVGVTPRRVLAAQQAIREEMARHPSAFLLREVSGLVGAPTGRPTRVRQAAAAVARFAGAQPDDLVFVDNATTGANAVLRSLPLVPGDEILLTNHTYGAVANAAAFVARERGATVRTVRMPYPAFDRGALLDAVEAAIGTRTRLAVFDHITSESALVLPIAELAARCRARGVPVLGGRRARPRRRAARLPSLGVDWYMANLHKWACAPHSCGFLWAAPARQSGLHPPVISWGLDKGFTAEFDWVGTRDTSAWLAAPEGLAFLADQGWDAMRALQPRSRLARGDVPRGSLGHAARPRRSQRRLHGHDPDAGIARRDAGRGGAGAGSAVLRRPHRSAGARGPRPPLGAHLRAGLQRVGRPRAPGRGRRKALTEMVRRSQGPRVTRVQTLAILAAAAVVSCARVPIAMPVAQASTCRSAVDERGQPLTLAIDWRLSDDPDDHAPHLARCRAVGPAVIDATPATDLGPSDPGTLGPSDVLTIATWNTHVGGGDVRAFVTALKSGALTSGEPVGHFVLFLQEVFRRGPGIPPVVPAGAVAAKRLAESPPSGPREDIVAAASSLGLALDYVPSTRNGADDVEDRGNAILSTLPLSGFTAIELPFERLRRVAIAATIDTGRGSGLRVASVHLDVLGGPSRLWIFASGLRDRQARALVAALDDGGPIVVGADLNTWADATSERAVATLHAAWPEAELHRLRSTFRFGLRLDYFFFRLGDGWRGEWRAAGSSFGSDHRPLVSRLSRR